MKNLFYFVLSFMILIAATSCTTPSCECRISFTRDGWTEADGLTKVFGLGQNTKGVGRTADGTLDTETAAREYCETKVAELQANDFIVISDDVSCTMQSSEDD